MTTKVLFGILTLAVLAPSAAQAQRYGRGRYPAFQPVAPARPGYGPQPGRPGYYPGRPGGVPRQQWAGAHWEFRGGTNVYVPGAWVTVGPPVVAYPYPPVPVVPQPQPYVVVPPQGPPPQQQPFVPNQMPPDGNLPGPPPRQQEPTPTALPKEQINKRNSPAVVFVINKWVPDGSSEAVVSTGTGFCVHSTGLIVTNRHVAMPWTDGNGSGRTLAMGVLFAGARDILPARLVREHPSKDIDLALIATAEPGSSLPVVAGVEQDDTKVSVGEDAYIIGYPLGGATAFEGGTVAPIPSFTAGSLSRKTMVSFQYDATSHHGSSGSPVFNRYGKVIAINYSGLESQKTGPLSGINYGIPARYLRELFQDQ